MKYTLEFVSELPDPEAYELLLREFYQIMVDKLAAVGGPVHSAVDLAAGTMAHLDDLTPPDGRTLLAMKEDGALLGCGVIRRIRPDAAELKRMYVRPDAQGLGIGRQLFEMRIAEARKMGCTHLHADTVKGNQEMLSMYEKFGFRYISRYPENANGPELAPYLVYLEHQMD